MTGRTIDKILITGTAGFIGFHLAKKLIENGYTVVGIDKVTVFDDLDTFVQTPKMTCHDFDAYTNLQFLKKLGKIESVYIIGVPSGVPEDSIKPSVVQVIKTNFSNTKDQKQKMRHS